MGPSPPQMCAVCRVKGGLRELVLIFCSISFQIIFLRMLGGASGEVVVGLELRSLAYAPPESCISGLLCEISKTK